MTDDRTPCATPRSRLLILVASLVPAGAALAADAPAPTPIAVEEVTRAAPVDFAKEVLPVLGANCLACHNRTKAKADLVLETPADMLKGGESGPAAMPGNGAGSLLVKLAAHRQEPVMPPAGNKVAATDLTPAQLGLIKLWIDQGAVGDARAAGAATGAQALEWQPLPDGLHAVHAVAMTGDGRFIAASRGGRVHVYSLPTRRLVADLADPRVPGRAAAHRDVVQSLAFSPDGGVLATGAYREVKVWRRPRDARKFAITGAARGAVHAAATSPDGKCLATGGADGVVRLWDASAGGRPVRELPGHAAAVRAVRFSPDGSRLVTAAEDKTLRVWRAEDATVLATAAVDGSPSAAVWAGCGQLVTGGADGVVRVWSVPEGPANALTQVRELKGHEGAVTSLDLPFSGNRLVSGGADGSVRVWDLAAGTELRRLDHGGPVTAVAVRSDGKLIVSAGSNGVARLWDAEGKPVELKGDLDATDDLRRRERDASAARAESEYRKAATGAAEKRQSEEVARVRKAALADAEADKALSEARKATGDAAAAAVKKAESAKAASDDELRRTIKAAQGAADAVSEAHAALAAAEAQQKRLEAEVAPARAAAEVAAKPLNAVAFSPDGTVVATAGEDGVVRLWGAEDATPLEAFAKGHGGAVAALAFAGDGVLVSGGADGSAVAWDLRPAWMLERTLGTGDAASPLADRVNAIDFSPDGRLIATGGGVPSREGEVALWDVASGSLVRRLERLHSDTVLALDFSWDGKRLATAGADRVVRVVDVAEGKPLRALEGHTGHVLSVAWKRDGRTVVSGSADKTVKVWDTVAGPPPKTVRGFEKEVTAVQFVGDGDQFVAAAGDGKVRLLKVDGGEVRGFAGAGGFVYSVATGRDGAVLVAGAEDGVLRAWASGSGEEVAQFPPPK